jgi:hypothetical protein
MASAQGAFTKMDVQTDQASRLVNMETTQSLEKIKSCRTLFRVAISVGSFLIMLSMLFAVICRSEGAAKLSLVWLALGIGGAWGIYIFVREGTILACLIATIERDGTSFIATTIFSRRVLLEHPIFTVCGPEWVRKRRSWPPYILRGTEAIQYARQASEVVKCVEMKAGQLRFYWVCKDTSSILSYADNGSPA